MSFLHKFISSHFGIACIALGCVFFILQQDALSASLLTATFDANSDGFTYVDDAFLGTNQPAYANGTYSTTGGYSGGAITVTLGGVNNTAIANMSGGWTRNLTLSSIATGVTLSFRYNLTQSGYYESDEYSRMLVTIDGTLKGRGTKPFVDHIGGDGETTTTARSTGWMNYQVYLGDLASGVHTITIGGYNSNKNNVNETTTIVIDDVNLTSDTIAPTVPAAQTIVNNLDIVKFKANIKTLSDFGDRNMAAGADPTSINNAQNWLQTQLQAMGYTVVRHNYVYSGTTRSNIYVTKVGTLHPDQMYLVTAQFDGLGGGGAADDNASGSSLLLECARVFALPGVRTDTTLRFIWFGNEETGLNGSTAYRDDRQSLQGVENPAGSGLYPEPRWLGLIQHDMVLYDHGNPAQANQIPGADIDVEYRAGTTFATQSQALAAKLKAGNGAYSTQYPAELGDYSTNTDDTPYQNIIPAVSVRENRRLNEIQGVHPYYHTANDLYANYSAADFNMGFNAVQMTVGTVADLAGAAIGAQLGISTSTLASGITGTSYSQTLAATGGQTPYTWSITTGSLPAGLSLNSASGVISGTPTTAGTSTFTVQAKDANNSTATKSLSIAVYAPLGISTSTLVSGTTGTSYSQTLAATGGQTPYAWSITTGNLPTGLTLNSASGVISGTPTTAGTSAFTIQVKDANNSTAAKSLSIAIYAPLGIGTSTLTSGTTGTSYSQALGATGGQTPYAWSITSGTSPAGLSLNSVSGMISGTPTTAGTSMFTVQVKDANNSTATKSFSIVIYAPLGISTSTLVSGTTSNSYSQTLAATGGQTPYTWSTTSGTLPAGLSLNSVSGVVSGTPTTTGTSTFTVQVKDANNSIATQSLSITVYAQLGISTSALVSGTTGNSYNQTLAAAGGQTPYAWSIAAGSLPAGLTLDSASGVVSGTPTTVGTSMFTVQVKDANNSMGTKSLFIAVYAPLGISTSTLASGTTGTSYSQTLAATGGLTQYVWSITTGSLPVGLTLDGASGVISGTPTTAGTSTFTVQVKDANNSTVTKSFSIAVYAQLSINTSTLSSGTIGSPYSQTLVATGGQTPYIWSITAGSLPTGLTLDGASGVISGTPTIAGTSTFTVQVKDANNSTATKSLSITVYAQLSISTSALVSGITGNSYSQTLAAAGGQTPYAWSIAAGSLPAGLTLDGASGVISGTPTAAGTSNVTVKVMDANNMTSTKALTITIASQLTVITSNLFDGKAGTTYSQTLIATGGVTPYTWSLTAGSLPAGLSLTSSTGAISGTPTTAGTLLFSVQVKDANDNTSTRALSITVQTACIANGDLNGDGVVDAGDVAMAQRIFLGIIAATPDQLCRGDVSPAGAPDGVIDAADLIVIQRKAMGLQ